MTTPSRVTPAAPPPRWRAALDLDGNAAPGIAWTPAATEDDLALLAPWREAVGPVRRGSIPSRPAQWPVTVAVWNLHVGGGAIGAFWQHLVGLAADHARSARELGPHAPPTPPAPAADGAPAAHEPVVRGTEAPGAVRPIVLLLQEVFAGDSAVPRKRPSMTGTARIAPDPPGEPRTDIVSFARKEGLSLLYVPSMRNGHEVREDRGNAILANVPLRVPRAIELPFERQRRVAITARVDVGGAAVELCSLHLENRSPWRQMARTLGAARARQMYSLLEVVAPLRLRLDPGRDGEDPRNPDTRNPDRTNSRDAAADPDAPFVFGGDFNTWVRGRRELAWRLARDRFPGPATLDLRPTHRHELGSWLRPSDHLMFRVPSRWHAECRRLDDTFGSDHYPLAGVMHPPGPLHPRTPKRSTG